MKVRLTHTPDGVLVEPIGVVGGPMNGLGTLVRPGESWRGFKYRRLRRLGEGEHVLMSKKQRAFIFKHRKESYG